MERPKKIAVLTKSHFKFQARDYRIDYYVWGKLSEFDSFSDYDVLVVDLASLRNPNVVRWHIFEKILTPVITRDILVGGGKVVILGNPNFQHQSVITKKRVQFLSWTGLACDWVEQSGDTIIAADSKLPEGIERYIQYLDRWNGAMRACDVYPGFSKMILRGLGEEDPNAKVRIECRHYYRNRYNCALAFDVSFLITRETGESKETIRRLGPILFLPETTLGAEENLEVVLRDICGVVTASREPGWATRLALPNHDELDKEIIERMAEIERHYERLRQLETLRSQSREALRLLYDSGSTLEEIVRVVLHDLGAEVIEPSERGADSGKVVVEVGGKKHEGMLYTLAITGSEFDEKDLDTLGRRLSLAIGTDRKEYKGVFIGNTSVDKSPEDRTDPFTFHFVENARLRHVALMTTQDLYDIYLMHLTDSLNKDRFWAELFSTDGQFDVRRLKQMAPIKQSTPSR